MDFTCFKICNLRNEREQASSSLFEEQKMFGLELKIQDKTFKPLNIDVLFLLLRHIYIALVLKGKWVMNFLNNPGVSGQCDMFQMQGVIPSLVELQILALFLNELLG